MNGKLGVIAGWLAFLAAAGWLTYNSSRAAADVSQYESAGPGAGAPSSTDEATSDGVEITAEEEWALEAAEEDSEGSDWGEP